MICIEYVLHKKENQTYLLSASARGLWIEIKAMDRLTKAVDRSASARGLWIEMPFRSAQHICYPVSFREGAVD